MDKAKIRLSPKEAELVANAGWILTKNDILQKVKYILEDLQSEQRFFFQAHPAILPAEVMVIPPKISKGENYKGLPYLVLDYPRFFDKDDHLAVRCMFWWGHFFSITLHLSGLYKKLFETKLESSLPSLKEEGFFISAGDDLWEHHFESTNYRPLDGMSTNEFREYCGSMEFIKLAKKFPFENWDNIRDILFVSFRKMVSRLAD